MKKIIYLFFFASLISCSNQKVQPNLTNKSQEQPHYSDDIKQEISLKRENLLKLLGEKRDKVLNINDLFEIKIPKSMEIVSINQYLLLDRDNTQYGISNYLDIVYQNKYIDMRIEIYGNTNRSFFDGEKIYNLRKIVNPDSYMSKNQVIYLKENYDDDPFTNKNQVKIVRFFSVWGTSWTSDYYGLYFTLPNEEFNECVISIYNIWGTFAKKETLDENYKEKIKKEGGNLEKIFKDLEAMENSITFNLTDKSIKIRNGSAGEQIIEDEYIYPAIDNLRMRSQPSLAGEILGYMKKEMYRVIVIGEEAEIEGIKGNWLMIIPWADNSASWVFSGYTRKATDEEMNSHFEW
jgi:hypothetical protein